jgi:hypothetical protein
MTLCFLSAADAKPNDHATDTVHTKEGSSPNKTAPCASVKELDAPTYTVSED